MLQLFLGRGAALRFRQPERADIVIQLRLKVIEAAIHPVGKDRLGLVQIARHVRVLRAAAGKHEDKFGVFAQQIVGKDPAGVAAFKKISRLVMAFGNQNPAFFEPLAAVFQCMGHIGQRLFGMGAQMGGQRPGIRLQRRFGAARDAQHMERPVAVAGCGAFGGLFQQRMGIGAADAQ